ncbi:MAG: ABC transporter ATP-binding protein, partial [Candidatus Omnitrophica bacterium]|nr:ABC transporter ATP-binding protein [Candidatus Omnitrophota bacterium]
CLDWSLERGSFSVVLGPNGAGKTTLFRLALGLIKPDSGSVFLSGRDTARMKAREIASCAAFVEQENSYAFSYTVGQIVSMGRFPLSGASFWDSDKDQQAVQQALKAVGLESFQNRPIQSLSGGEKRRAEIARALCQEAELLLLDEPAAFLDLRQQAELMNLLVKLNREKGLTILMVSHQPGLARGAAREAVYFSGGKIRRQGLSEELLQAEALAEFFQIPPGMAGFF